MLRPRFITFEGGEGAGKSTQAKLLAAALTQTGIDACVTREPGGSPGAEAIRGLVVQGEVDRWHPTTEALLFMTARYDHVETLIKPALARNAWVVCDRFYDSTYVYQGIGKAVGTDWLDQAYALLLGNFAPDLTLWLDIPPATGLARAEQRATANEARFESMGLAYHEALRDGFALLASSQPKRITRIHAQESAIAVHAAIIDTINARFSTTLTPAAF
jgi:dTMP kinase